MSLPVTKKAALAALALFILFYISMTSAAVTDSKKSVDEDCVNKIKTKYPRYKDRFRDEVLNRSCVHSRMWKEEAIAGVGKAAKDPKLTPSQLKYFNSVTTCKGLQCLCDQWDLCRQLMAKLKQSFGSLNDLGDKIKNSNLGDLFKNGNGADNGLSSLFQRPKRQVDLNAQLQLLQRFGKSTRKEIRSMTDDERKRLFVAFNTLKTDKIDNLTKYDILIVYHTPEYAPEAHFGSAFLPYHRELIKNIELALRLVDPQVSIPYWDSTLDSYLPVPADSILWSEDFLGNGDGELTIGPFANWTTIPDAQIPDLSPKKKIVRGVGQSPFGSVFKEADAQTILSKPDFRSLVFCVDPFYELVHGALHLFVGGHMIELRTSPNDPMFFMIHTWVDALWEFWRQSKQTVFQRESVYVADNETCNAFSQGDAQMKPFPVKIKDGLLNKYVNEFFNYQPRPTCSAQRPSCDGSQYLYCDVANSRCVSKIRAKGNCTGFEGKDICYKGACTNGICVPSTQTDVTTAATPAPTIPTTTTTTTTPAPTTTTTTPAPTTITTTPTTTTTTTTVATTTAATTPATTAAPTTTVTVPTTEIAPQTAPPQNGTAPPVPATVWFPVTVLLVQNGNASAAYPKAKILTSSSIGKTYDGIMADPKDQPYYTGAAYAQMPNPFAGVSPVISTLAVYDEFNKLCTTVCLQNETSYGACTKNPSVTLDVDPAKSDKVPSTPNLALAKLLNWRGYRRSFDKYMFLCDPQAGSATPAPVATTTVASGSATTAAGTTNSYNISIGNGKYINIVTKNDASHQIANGGCHNLHRCCDLWANVGECTRNKWMQAACQWACHVCNPGENITAAECCDYHPRCGEWAAAGKCTKNAIWMEENCKETCKVCSRTHEDLGLLCGVPKKQGCKNYNDGCDNWAKKGECTRNPWWMAENCPLACKKCTA